MTDRDERGAIGFAEKVLELLDEGRYTATYKYAVMLALIITVCITAITSLGSNTSTTFTKVSTAVKTSSS